MSQGLFNEGRLWQARKAYRNELPSTTLSVGLYTNARNTLTNRNVLADIVPVVGSGYAAIVVTANLWTVATDLAADPVDDAVSIIAPANIFAALSIWPNVTGAYLFDSVSGIAIAWKDHALDEPMPNGGKFRVRFNVEGAG